MSEQQAVENWRRSVGLPCNDTVAIRNVALHARLINEEVSELITGLESGDVVEVADGIADAMVVLRGIAADCGIDITPVFQEVMRSNWTKTAGIKDAGGKLQKGPNFEPPRIAELLREQGWNP